MAWVHRSAVTESPLACAEYHVGDWVIDRQGGADRNGPSRTDAGALDAGTRRHGGWGLSSPNGPAALTVMSSVPTSCPAEQHARMVTGSPHAVW